MIGTAMSSDRMMSSKGGVCVGFWEVDDVFTVLWWVPEVHIQGPIRAQQIRQCLPLFLCQHCFVLCRRGDRKLSDTAELGG